MTESQPTTLSKDTIRKALTAYRVMAWATGIWLIALCYELVAHYIFNDASLNWIGIVHGWVYFVYLIFCIDLAIKARWGFGKTLGTALAGTIPFLSFYVEHIRTRDVKQAYGL